MSEFFEVVSPAEAISKITSHNDFRSLKTETLDTISCHNRITSENVTSNSDLPHFNRSSMDGYAIKSNDSSGVSSSSPNYIKVIEEIKMGYTPNEKLKNGECSRIFTGGMIPEGADSVIMEEDTEILNDDFIEIKKSLSVGENIIFKGEETKKNNLILSKGHKIRSQDIGSMLESGITSLKVYKKLIIGVLSSGDELLDPSEDLQPAKIRDINTYTISTLIKSIGHKVKNFPIMPDNFESQLEQAKKAFNECDILIFSAGSSISYRDTTSKVISNLGLPGILVHGVSVKPGKPTILAICDKKIIIGLPGNPVSASMIFTNIIRPIIYKTYNFEPLEPYILCKLNDDISSHTGRVDYVPVKLSVKDGISYAQPILGKSNLINTLVHSDGYITVPSEKRGLYKNSTVKVSNYE
tara:strand:+ start:1738 stop:2970 length:1233 start_codon:yes stop_codon:yes gene_type:complete